MRVRENATCLAEFFEKLGDKVFIIVPGVKVEFNEKWPSYRDQRN